MEYIECKPSPIDRYGWFAIKKIGAGRKIHNAHWLTTLADDGETHGFNHSCNANCKLVRVKKTKVHSCNQIAIPLRDIDVGEELTVDYGKSKPNDCNCEVCRTNKV